MQLCFACGGTGSKICDVCHGKGLGPAISRRDGSVDAPPCAACGGRRHVQCQTCKGTGPVATSGAGPSVPSLPSPPAERPLCGRWQLEGGEWMITPVPGIPFYAVSEAGALGTTNGMAFPLEPHQRDGFQYNNVFAVGFKNHAVGHISYVLEFDGLHTLQGQAYLNEKPLTRLTIRRTAYD